MAANHERDTRQRTATELGPLRDAVQLLADHGYAVTTATIAADPSPEACATITLELTVPAAGSESSGAVSADEPEPGTEGSAGDADVDDATGAPDPSTDADATENAGGGSVTLDTTAPLTRREDCDRAGDERAMPANSSRDGVDATGEDASADADGEREEATDERWCRKCGYGPGTKRAIAIHNGHAHGGDAEYAATEPAPEDGAESGAPDRSEEIDAIVESVIASDSPAADDADAAAQAPDDPAGGSAESEEPSDAADSDDSTESTADPSRTDGGDGHPTPSDDGDAAEANSAPAPADASPAEAPDEYGAELPDLGFPIPDRITVAAVHEAVAGAEDLQDVRESLKWPVGHCRILLEEMGLGEELLDAPPGYSSRQRSKRSV